MGFDLPDESQNPAGLRGLTGHQQQSGKSSLPNELDPQIPSRLAIAMELEVIKFSATASRENQDEILSEKAVVPALLSLLGACQRASVGLRGQALERALETAVLVLQVLVNLSHGSTEFCSQFIRLRGLEAVARSVVFVSHSMAGGTAAAAAAAPKDVGDLCYDTLLIASALLTNIVDADSSAATHFGFVFQNPHCLLAAQCYPECVCANRSSLVALLARAFAVCHAMAGTADSSHSDAAVAAGYLAVLLGFLMRDNPGGHRAILQYLPQKSVAPVVARIGAFVRLSDSVASRFGKLLGGLGTAAFGLSEVGSGAQNPLLAPPSTESPPLPLSVTRSLADTAGGLRASANSGESPVAASLQSVIAALQSIQ
ncbi:hypothetical protein FBU59_003102 [Linderina macrospora]|uniref:Uncharacterized protein n=1 Tax=Linderina macrospora TaxID=4868 RepID=A0ACC1J9M7_9FUNG|nr:hypothetical protein FBU59_003102 [Linderina macrospora]